jgi:hypothetical protein
MPRRYFLFFLTIIASAAFFWGGVLPSKAASDLSGRILLQVESKGEAWYVNPLDGERYYLGRPDDAFQLIRSLGLGVSNQDFASFQKQSPNRLLGRILLLVEGKGEAYYLDPVDKKLYYLGRPADAFSLMRSRGLGISNADLSKITAAKQNKESVAVKTSAVIATGYSRQDFSFKYQNRSFALSQDFSDSLYQEYHNSSKSLTYKVGQEPANLRDAFYSIFFLAKSGDHSLEQLIMSFKGLALQENWSSDQLVEAVLAFVQYIPYDQAKVASGGLNDDPYYPYETLYLKRGVCSDKTFLAVALLRRLGYGVAIFDFPDINHSAAGLACPKEYSLASSGYCYVETTNYFPIGVVPSKVSASGAQEVLANDFEHLFEESSLGKIEIYQESRGNIYQGAAAVRQEAAAINTLKHDLQEKAANLDSKKSSIESEEARLETLKAELDEYLASGRLIKYSSAVKEYNAAITAYNASVQEYKDEAAVYNQSVLNYNTRMNSFYQK